MPLICLHRYQQLPIEPAAERLFFDLPQPRDDGQRATWSSAIGGRRDSPRSITWVRYRASVAGPQLQGIYDDRVTMLVDDGSVPEFARYGGYVAVGDRMRFFTDEAKPDEVKAHPYLGQKRKQTEVGKYLPATRSNINDWASVVPEEELAALRKAGYFLDLWLPTTAIPTTSSLCCSAPTASEDLCNGMDRGSDGSAWAWHAHPPGDRPRHR
jgi:hypothetical protein